MLVILLVATVSACVPVAAAVPHLVEKATDPLCGAKGWDKGKPEAYNYIASGASGWEASCVAACAHESKCNSFALGKSECLLYTSKLYVVSLR